MTRTGWPLSAAGRAGPASCHVPSFWAKMPTVPARPQVPASSGDPAGV